MSITGAINGTKVLVSNSVGVIVGQGNLTVAHGGTPIEISNKSCGDKVTYLDGEAAAQQKVFTMDFTYNNDASYVKMRADSEGFILDTYTVTFTSTNTTDESWTGLFMPSGMSDTVNQGEKLATTLTLSSSGDYTYTPPVV